MIRKYTQALGWMVDSMGLVRRLNSNEIMSLGFDDFGIYRVSQFKNGEQHGRCTFFQ